MYLGNQPADAYTSFAKQDFTTSATTSYTLDYPVANANEIALFINFVRQEPTTAYTASGTSLTLTSATSASDDMYAVFIGKALQTVNPPAGSVGTSQLEDGAVTKAKTTDLLYPAFRATVGTTTNVTHQVITKMAFDTEVFDTDNCYDPTTNYRFTPTVAGKYQVQSMAILAGDQNTLNSTIIYLYKNGSEVIQNQFRDTTNEMHRNGHNLSVIVDMNGTTDYLEMFCRIEVDSGTPQYFSTSSNFQAYRIGA